MEKYLENGTLKGSSYENVFLTIMQVIVSPKQKGTELKDSNGEK